MADICDRSPCDRLMGALGEFMFGIDTGRGFAQFSIEVVTLHGRNKTAPIDYCPFCGTRLEEIGPGLLDKFLPKRKL